MTFLTTTDIRCVLGRSSVVLLLQVFGWAWAISAYRAAVQVITLLAATKEYIFDPKRATPRAVIFVMDQKQRYRQYQLVFEGEVEREWRERILPKAVRFYLTNMLPRIAASKPLSELPTTFVSSPARRVSLPAPGLVGSSTNVALVSPTIKPGKTVRRPRTKQVGVVKKLDLAAGKAEVEWEGHERKRAKMVAVENLEVDTRGDQMVAQPDRLGQAVVIVGGKKEWLNKRGKIISINPSKCKVELEEGSSSVPLRVVSVPVAHVAALDGPREVTVPAAASDVNMPLDEVVAWVQEYQEKKMVQLTSKIDVATFIEAMKRKAAGDAGQKEVAESRPKRRAAKSKVSSGLSK
jgi:hypothetical protein